MSETKSELETAWERISLLEADREYYQKILHNKCKELEAMRKHLEWVFSEVAKKAAVESPPPVAVTIRKDPYYCIARERPGGWTEYLAQDGENGIFTLATSTADSIILFSHRRPAQIWLRFHPDLEDQGWEVKFIQESQVH